jgi:putative radical SAM enzyme (TIGR03279 family)
VSGVRISSISASSPATGTDIEVGDELVSINGREPTDIIEYQQLIDGDTVTLVLQREGRPLRHKVTINKLVGEPLGLSIDSAVFDRIRTCDNHCTFCFIYQLPKGMRRSLYVKDDDFRLSFLYGNYTTLTRFTEFDLERVIDERLSPLYVSIHSTNPELRAQMLRNPRGATSLRWLRELLKAGIEVHAQVVVCPGVNDGDELERTLQDVVTLYPDLATVALVPVGVSDFTLEETMRPHTRGEAQHVIELAEKYRRLTKELFGRVSVYASDEFYLVAGRTPQPAGDFESLDQAENGIGLVAAFLESFAGHGDMDKLGTGFFQSIDGAPALGYRAARTEGIASTALGAASEVALITGEYAAPILRDLLDRHHYDDVKIITVENHYFGGNIKVAGLMTGQDLRRALVDVPATTTCLLPDVCLSEGRFLDGLSVEDLPHPVNIVRTTGQDLRAVLQDVRTKGLVHS